MKRAIKKPLSIVLVMIILTCMALPQPGASAVDFLDGDKRLTVEVKYGENAVRNIDVGICRVATASMGANGKVKYSLVPEFADADDIWLEELDNISAAELRELSAKLVNFARSNEIVRVTDVTNANGIVIFEELQPGIYLVMQENSGGTRYRFSPTLVLVGLLGTGVHAVVIPKVEYIREPPNPPKPSVTPSVTPTPTEPTPSVTPTPTVPTPTPDGDDVPLPSIPGEEFPPDDGEKPPGKVVQTGVVDLDTIIILLAVVGVLLLVIGVIQEKRNPRDERLSVDGGR